MLDICRKEYQGEPLEMEADAEAEETEEDMEVSCATSSPLRQLSMLHLHMLHTNYPACMLPSWHV